MQLLKPDYLDKIVGMPLFDGVRDEDLGVMMGCLNGYTRTFKKGSYLLISDEPVPSVGVVLSGNVQMLKEDFWGGKSILAISNPGDLFAETFICAGITEATVSFYAPVDTEVLYIPFNRVMHSCSNSCMFHHKLIENMMVMVAKKNLKLMEKLEITSKKTLRERILTYLSREALKNGSKYIHVPMSRNELAEYLCADRSALSRELSNMKRDGLLDYDKNTFFISR